MNDAEHTIEDLLTRAADALAGYPRHPWWLDNDLDGDEHGLIDGSLILAPSTQDEIDGGAELANEVGSLSPVSAARLAVEAVNALPALAGEVTRTRACLRAVVNTVRELYYDKLAIAYMDRRAALDLIQACGHDYMQASALLDVDHDVAEEPATLTGAWRRIFGGADKWGQLRAVVGEDQLHAWMAMSGITNGHVRIWRYKHLGWRGYLSLDARGRAYRVTFPLDGGPGTVVEPIPLTVALAEATGADRVGVAPPPDKPDPAACWVHGTRLGRHHRSVRQHLIEDHGLDPAAAAAISDGTVLGEHDARHAGTWSHLQDLPHTDTPA